MTLDLQQAVQENPLLEGLERLPVPATTLVDLRRHRRPRAAQAAARDLQPRPRGRAARALRAVGASRRDESDEAFRDQAREAIERLLAPHAGRAGARLAARPPALRVRPLRRARGLRAAGRGDRRARRRGRRAAEPLLLPLHGAGVLPGHRPGAEGARACTATRTAAVRCIIEKPFGTDLASARSLQEIVACVFHEDQVFRIDHYLGKETVQNLLAFRFANAMFEPVWNRNYIDHVQITVAEDLGIGSRAGYYDHAGALRDLVQNHMLQLLTLLCMEPPADLRRRRGPRREGQGAARDHAADAVEEVPRDGGARAVRAPACRAARRCPATSRRQDVPPDSHTETYAALRLEVAQLALGRRADLPAHRQAPRAQGHRDRGPAQAGAAPGVPVAAGRSACSPTCSCSPSSPTRASRSRSARRSPAAACASAR